MLQDHAGWQDTELAPPPPWISYALVQATVGVGTVLIWDFGVAWRGVEMPGAEADFHCDTMVQICGAVSPPPPPRGGGDRHFVTAPPPPRRGGTGPTKGGRFQGGQGVP